MKFLQVKHTTRTYNMTIKFNKSITNDDAKHVFLQL